MSHWTRLVAEFDARCVIRTHHCKQYICHEYPLPAPPNFTLVATRSLSFCVIALSC